MHFGLIGQTLSHSFSKEYFTQKLGALGISGRYDLFELADIADFPSLLKKHSLLKGLNVTIPYKSSIMPYLDEIDDTAMSIGAVNTVQIKNGKTKGYNTDCFGFEQTLLRFFSFDFPHKALIFGTGGSAKAVAYVLKKYNFDVTYISRIPNSNNLSYASINEALLKESALLVNCTPVGMFPNIDATLPLPFNLFGANHYFIDLIYNPSITATAVQLEANGVHITNGLDMLYAQAEKSWEIWMR
jgi:shikimate dehydrogenase